MIKYKVNENTKIKYCDRIFEIRDKITGNIFMYKPQLEIDNSFNPDDFEIYFLYNSNYRTVFIRYMLMIHVLAGYFQYSL